jgi:hypothetical protein
MSAATAVLQWMTGSAGYEHFWRQVFLTSFFLCKCAVELTEGACAGDRREDRSAEGARSRSVHTMGAQWAAQVVQDGPVVPENTTERVCRVVAKPAK